MAQKFKQLSIEEREKIQLGLWGKKSIRSIARELDRPPSTISREVKKNLPKEIVRYSPRLADRRAKTTIVSRGRRPRLKNEFIKNYVIEKLELRWSPEQISGELKKKHKQKISPEAIYQFIYSQYYRGGNGRCIGLDLIKHLRRRHKRRSRKYVPYTEVSLRIKDKVSIEDRPAIVDRRKQFGHWETDSMVSRQSSVALNSTVERVSGLLFISKIANMTGKNTSDAVINRLNGLPKRLKRTITSDNGFEFSNHKTIRDELGVKYFFCHPYSSHERGTNENTNGLVRDFFPKKTDFATIDDREIEKVEYLINTRPRKRLNWRTPLEVLSVALTH